MGQPRLALSAATTRGGAKKVATTGTVAATGAFCLRCNAWRGELGQEPDVQSYVSHLVAVFAAVKRVLRPDGCLFVNISDSYATKPNNNAYHGKGRDTSGLTNPERQTAVRNGSKYERIPDGLKPKDLMLVPDRFRIAMQESGWYVRSKMPWLKRSCMPESVRDRPVSAVEDVILFTKSGSYFWDSEAVRRTNSAGTLARHSGQPESPVRNRYVDNDHGHRVHTGKLNQNGGWDSGRHYRTSDMFFDSLGPLLGAADEPEPTPQPDRSDAGPPFPPQGLILDEDGDPLALDVNPAGYDGAHFATFPPKLVRPLILAGTSEKGACAVCGGPWVRVVEKDAYQPEVVAVGVRNVDLSRGDKVRKLSGGSKAWLDVAASSKTTGWLPSCRCSDPGPPVPCTLLDPFAGSGTALMEADRLGRDAVGIDLNDSYVTMQTERLATDQGPLFADVEVVK